MRVRLLSDLHLEFYRDAENFFNVVGDCEQDVLVLAGDIVTFGHKDWALDTLRLFQKYFTCPVIFVPGNHCYYKADGPNTDLVLRSIPSLPGLDLFHVLIDGESASIAGQRFIGGTMWYEDSPSNNPMDRNMMDGRCIGRFKPWVYQRNEALTKALQINMEPSDIVVTHHMPSYKCVLPEFKGSPLNRFFACPQDELIAERKPKAWLFGHTHGSMDFKIDETRVICNPKGYTRLGEDSPLKSGENPQFNPNLVIEIP